MHGHQSVQQSVMGNKFRFIAQENVTKKNLKYSQ